jgi:hypothetical protein
MGKRILLVIAAVIVLLFTWHLYLTGEARRVAHGSSAKATEGGAEATLSMNPVTNVVEITVAFPPPELDEKNPWAAVGSQFGAALAGSLVKIIEPLVEHELNTKAREKLDLYAMLVPYRLRVTLKEPDQETLARIRARREELRRAEREQKLEKGRSYVREGLSLENIRVAPGERFGCRVCEGKFLKTPPNKALEQTGGSYVPSLRAFRPPAAQRRVERDSVWPTRPSGSSASCASMPHTRTRKSSVGLSCPSPRRSSAGSAVSSAAGSSVRSSIAFTKALPESYSSATTRHTWK